MCICCVCTEPDWYSLKVIDESLRQSEREGLWHTATDDSSFMMKYVFIPKYQCFYSQTLFSQARYTEKQQPRPRQHEHITETAVCQGQRLEAFWERHEGGRHREGERERLKCYQVSLSKNYWPTCVWAAVFHNQHQLKSACTFLHLLLSSEPPSVSRSLCTWSFIQTGWREWLYTDIYCQIISKRRGFPLWMFLRIIWKQHEMQKY